RVASPKVRERGHTTPVAYELASDTCYGLGVVTNIAVHYCPEQLIFADESHFNQLTLRRPHAWAKRGERASCHEFQFRGAKYSMLPALSLDGILHLDVVENAVTGAAFRHFVEGLLPR